MVWNRINLLRDHVSHRLPNVKSPPKVESGTPAPFRRRTSSGRRSMLAGQRRVDEALENSVRVVYRCTAYEDGVILYAVL